MQNLNLNDLLRYGLAGAIFLVFLVAAFDEPQAILKSSDSNGVVAAGLIGIAFTIGSLVYATHRAVPYPAFYWLFAKLNKRPESTMQMDIKRWRNLSKKDSLQQRMGDWAAQVHFLYCIAWAGSTALLLGRYACWAHTNLWNSVASVTGLMFVCALLHHCRYQRWEKQIFVEDESSKAS